MILLTLISLISLLVFGSIAIWISWKEEKTKKLLLESQEKYKKQLFGISLLKEVQERISYELDIKKVADVIMENLQNLVPFSVISFLSLEDNKLIFTARITESVSNKFLQEAKINTLTFLSAIIKSPLPGVSEERIQGIVNEHSDYGIASMFHVPLTIEDKVKGVLSIFSNQKNIYKKEDMYLLEQIVMQASSAVSKLHEVLAVEQGKLLAMIGSLTDGVLMIDINNQVVAINNAAKMLLNVHKNTPTLFDIVNAFPQGFDFVSKVQDMLGHNKSLRTSKLILGDKTVEVYITPVTKSSNTKSSEKEVIGAAVLIHDMTIEEDLEKVKEDFTNIVVHELRAPLSAIKSSSQLMLESPKSFTQEEQNKLLSVINEQAQKLLSQVSSILDVAKLKSGKFTIDKHEENIKEIIAQSIAIFAPQAKTRQIQLISHIDETLPLVLIDKSRIGEVINNLLSNSLKFTPGGGKVSVEAKQDMKNITVSVIDSGVGIAEERQSQLFSKFSQLSAGTSSNKQPILGTGLGLYIVKGIVEAHGGYVILHSKPNQGTTITFTLPIDGKEIHEEKLQEEKQAIPLSAIGTSVN